jgi:hypothetical protein
MVVTLMVIARKVFHLEQLVTMKHLENMNKVILGTGLIVGFSYATEFFIAWYRQPVRAIRLLQPGVRAVLVGGLDHDFVQRACAPVVLVQAHPDEHTGDVRDLHPRERRDVV